MGDQPCLYGTINLVKVVRHRKLMIQGQYDKGTKELQTKQNVLVPSPSENKPLLLQRTPRNRGRIGLTSTPLSLKVLGWPKSLCGYFPYDGSSST